MTIRMPVRTRLEICTQATNLQIALISAPDTEKFGILIARGREHRHSELIITDLVFDDRKSAYRNLVGLLKKMQMKTESAFLQIKSGHPFKGGSSPLTYMFNPDKLPLSKLPNALTTERLTVIKHELKTRNTVNTYELFAT